LVATRSTKRTLEKSVPRAFDESRHTEKPERSSQRPDDVVAHLSEQTLAIEQLTETVARREPLVGVKTAAEHVGVSTRTLHRMVADELVPYRPFGRTLSFSLAAFGPFASSGVLRSRRRT
jgi:hypothetical protein